MLLRSIWARAMNQQAALATLGLASSVSNISHASIKKAYIAQTFLCHPDLHPNDPDATEKFRRLSEAFNVALKCLEMRSRAGAAVKHVSLDDSQCVLEALRHAMVAYHKCRETIKHNSGVDNGGSDFKEQHSESFSSHSLEYVSSVCQSEARAMLQVKQFCCELPEVLCGKSCVLFETVAFFNMRYVEAMSRCVLRFSKNLPIIVNRVVKGRKKHVRHTLNKANSGFGTGNRPCTQQIENMAMKPLVLVGALIFDQEFKLKEKRANHSKGYVNNHELPENDHDDVRSTCGVSSPSEIKICEELKCIIYPSDSIGNIVEKIGKWEASSYERLQLELAMVDTTSLLSGILGLNEHGLVVMHHLHLSKKISEKVSFTLQKLACALCYHCDENPQSDGSIIKKDDRENQGDELRFVDGINRCRHLARATESYIEGNINLMWDEQTPLVESTDEVGVGDEEGIFWRHAKNVNKGNSNNDVIVVRHRSCCTAEMIRFSIFVKLSKDTGEFLSRLVNAMEIVLEETNIATNLLPQLLDIREKVVNSEFIPEEEMSCKSHETTFTENNGKENTLRTGKLADTVTNNLMVKEPFISNSFGVSFEENGCEEKERYCDEKKDRKYRYRGPIHCFPRIFSMSTAQELSYWSLVHDNRVYLAQHAPAMNPINVYCNCLPYKSHQYAMDSGVFSNSEEVLGGWVGEADDGTDAVVITNRELENKVTFREWLEEIVEQSLLNKECHRVADEAGIGYVTRDPVLPLTQYLSFLKVFCAASCVRAIIERKAGKTRTATPEETGLVIVVGNECDVRDGGRLLVPWWMDPSVLLALLHDSGVETSTFLKEDGGAVSQKIYLPKIKEDEKNFT